MHLNPTSGIQLSMIQFPQSEPRKRTPEDSLLSAILHRALLDLVDEDFGVQSSAYYWCHSEKIKCDYGGFTFIQICELLDIDAVSLRQQVIKVNLFVNGSRSDSIADVLPFYGRLKQHGSRGRRNGAKKRRR